MNIANFNGFGYRELDMAADLLKKLAANGVPDGVDLDLPVSVQFNEYSGAVFLVDEDDNNVVII